MFGFKNFFKIISHIRTDHEKNQTPSNLSDGNHFTTQADILTKKEQSVGLCNPLTNLYASERIQYNETPSFKDNKTAYAAAVELENEQLAREKKGEKDTRHIAFRGIPHADVEITKEEFASPHIFHKIFDSSVKHSLISYPTENNKAHMVYFGKDNKVPTTCYFFDANMPKGEVEGPCEKVKEFMHAHIKRNISNDSDPRSLLIGTIRGPSPR